MSSLGKVITAPPLIRGGVHLTADVRFDILGDNLERIETERSLPQNK